MKSTWEQNFPFRFDELESSVAKPDNAIPLSIKVRVTTGCYHREHSPEAYEIIDSALRRNELARDNARFEEHESGPEVLLWLTVAAGSLNLATSIINMVTAIIRARSEGITKGDRPDGPLEVIVRGVRLDNEYIEQRVLLIESQGTIDESEMQEALDRAITEMFSDAVQNE